MYIFQVNDYWLGAEFLVLLDMNNIGSSRFPAFHNASKEAIQNFEKIKQDPKPDKTIRVISRDTKKILEHLSFSMQMLTSDISVNDYRVCVVESMEPSGKKKVSLYIFEQFCHYNLYNII